MKPGDIIGRMPNGDMLMVVNPDACNKILGPDWRQHAKPAPIGMIRTQTHCGHYTYWSGACTKCGAHDPYDKGQQ